MQDDLMNQTSRSLAYLLRFLSNEAFDRSERYPQWYSLISQYITTITVMRWVPRPLLILAFGVGAGLCKPAVSPVPGVKRS